MDTPKLRSELTKLAESMINQLPCSIDNPKNKVLEDNTRKSMSAFFLSMEKAFPYHMLPKVYEQSVKEVLTAAPPPPPPRPESS